MAYKVQKPCKVCGKMFTPCADCERDKTAFHWRTVACSVECGKKYFEMVMKARSKTTVKKKAQAKPPVAAEAAEAPTPSVDVVVEEKSKNKGSENIERIE